MGRYVRPTHLDEALGLMGVAPWRLFAGGTDIYPAHVDRLLDGDLLDLAGIRELRGIEHGDQGTRIGAMVTWRELLDHALPPCFQGLRQAAVQIGGAQIQNAGTLGGNICNASPAADAVPPLLSLGARVELRSAEGAKSLPLAEFIRGNRATALGSGEILVAIHIPPHTRSSRACFLKLGSRSHLVISIVSVAAMIEPSPDGRSIEAAAIAVGACSAVAMRLAGLERRLEGRTISEKIAGLVERADLAPLSPIDDIRGTADYRLASAETLVRRALSGLARELMA